MRKFINILSVILFLGFGSETKSQCTIIDKNLTIKSIKPNITCFVDSLSEHTYRSVQSREFKGFSKIRFPKFLVSAYRYTFWFRFCLENQSDTTQDIVLTMGEVYRQEFWLNDSLHLLLSQDKRLAANQYVYDHKYLKYRLLPRQKLKVLVKVNDLVGQEFLLNPHVASLVYEQESRLENLYQERWTFWQNIALKAILLFVALFVFVEYYFVRYRFFLYYGFYVLNMTLFHVHGFMYSTYIQEFNAFFSFIKFDIRANFYIITTQIFYMLFLRDFFDIRNKGTRIQCWIFETQMVVFYGLLVLEMLFIFVFHRLDYELILALITQIFVIIISIYLLIMMFTARNFEVLPSIKWASVLLFIGVIWGFVSAYFGWVKTYSPFFQYYPNFFFNFCVFAEVFLYSIAMGQLFTKNISERSLLSQKSALSELNTLRSQINPHFLFNSLNSVKGLIIKQKSEEAVEFLTDISSYIRKILHQSREQLLSLEEELELTEEYLKIEKKRFKNTFTYDIQKPSDTHILQQYFPALTLQPFVENCLKHGFNHQTINGFISIKVVSTPQDFCITIEDNGIGREASAMYKAPNSTHQSVGTKLIEERFNILNQLYSWNVRFELIDKPHATGTIVKITVPFLQAT